MSQSLWRLCACIVVIVAVAGDCALSERFLPWPFGVIIYLPAAVCLTIPAFLLAVFAWTTGRPGAAGYAAAVISAVMSVLGVPFGYERVVDYLYHRDPIGIGDDVARGPCRTREIAAIPNRRGLVAEVRETYCYGNWDGDLMYFVFVHGLKEANTRLNLVFRYRADTLPDVHPPQVGWVDANRLSIIAEGVMDVSEQRARAEYASIAYEVRFEFPQ